MLITFSNVASNFLTEQKISSSQTSKNFICLNPSTACQTGNIYSSVMGRLFSEDVN